MADLKKLFIVILLILFVSVNSFAWEVILSAQPIVYNKYKTWTPEKVEQTLSGDNIMALVSLGTAYHFGRGVAQDRNKAFELFKRGAEAKDIVGLFNYALYIKEGYCGEPDYALAEKILKEIIKMDPKFYSAYFPLGYIYTEGGYGVDRDYGKAFQNWESLSRLPESGEYGRWNMANLFFEGKGVEKDLTKAKNLISQDAENGWLPAQMRLGEFLAIEKNYKEAEKWLLKGYENVNARVGERGLACYYLGNLYSEREDSAQSFSKALEFYQKGFENNVSCKYKLACLLRDGKAGIKDIAESNRLFLEAADGGLGQAAYEVANLYYWGSDYPQDYEKAVFYFKLVLEKHAYNPNSVNAETCRKLSACYRFGRGVEKNETIANEYLSRSAEFGDPDAGEILKWLENPE